MGQTTELYWTFIDKSYVFKHTLLILNCTCSYQHKLVYSTVEISRWRSVRNPSRPNRVQVAASGHITPKPQCWLTTPSSIAPTEMPASNPMKYVLVARPRCSGPNPVDEQRHCRRLGCAEPNAKECGRDHEMREMMSPRQRPQCRGHEDDSRDDGGGAAMSVGQTAGKCPGDEHGDGLNHEVEAGVCDAAWLGEDRDERVDSPEAHTHAERNPGHRQCIDGHDASARGPGLGA